MTRLQGYRAAEKLIESMLDDAEKERPKKLVRINTRSADYRAGVYRAALSAHCAMVLGEFPNNPINKVHIKNILNIK